MSSRWLPVPQYSSIGIVPVIFEKINNFNFLTKKEKMGLALSRPSGSQKHVLSFCKSFLVQILLDAEGILKKYLFLTKLVTFSQKWVTQHVSEKINYRFLTISYSI